MKDLVVYDGHFWVNMDGILSKKRSEEIRDDARNTDRLLLVKDQLWARLEKPHPTRKQSQICRATWRPEDVEIPNLLKVPKAKEKN
jgi:hypothetical protein